MFCLVRRDLRQEIAVASADRDADLDAAVRRSFREPSLAPDHDCHPSASAGAEQVALQANSGMPPRVADRSVGQALGVRIVAVAKVVGHRDLVRRGEGRRIAANLAAEEARRVAALGEGLARVRLAVSAQQVPLRATQPEQRAARPLALELPLEAEQQVLPPQV